MRNRAHKHQWKQTMHLLSSRLIIMITTRYVCVCVMCEHRIVTPSAVMITSVSVFFKESF